MLERSYKYIVVGGGLAGASAVDAIRESDPNGPLLLIGSGASRAAKSGKSRCQAWFSASIDP